MTDTARSSKRFPAVRSALALVSGALSALGFQPLGLWPLTLAGIAVLIGLTVRAPRLRSAFFVGWLFGLGHFTVGNYWIATAFTYQAEMPHWLGSLAVVLLSVYLALFPALATLATAALSRRMLRNAPDHRIYPALGILFAAFWILTEWTRSWLFTGFAWNPLGVALLGPFDGQGLASIARGIGTYGLSGMAAAIGAVLWWLAERTLRGSGKRRALAAGAGLAVMAIVAVAMATPLRDLDPTSRGRAFTLVQPDLRQEVLDDPRLFETNFLRLARLTPPVRSDARRIVFWPESGLADYLRDGYPQRYYEQMTYAADPRLARQRIGQLIAPYGVLLTGAVDLKIGTREPDAYPRALAAWNSVTAIDYRGRILSGYAKAHLVPYGEYLPMRTILEPLGLSRLVAGSLDFWAGPGPRTMDLGAWGKAGVQICYEIVFSGEVVDPALRPDYLFNPSNDGWFGAWGPPQHLAQARLRALEEGLPILRATTTGISAVIDADGIVRASIPRHTAGRIDGFIPPRHEPTFFARHGNTVPVGLALVLVVLSAVALRRASR